MTRTPAMPSCRVDMLWPMFSRTSRYAAFESRWNLREATTMIGNTSRPTSASCHESANSRISENTISIAADANWSRPNWTSSPIDSTSAVMRAISTPDLIRSKKASDWRWMWSNTRTRRARRNPSPARLIRTYCWRDAAYAPATTIR